MLDNKELRYHMDGRAFVNDQFLFRHDSPFGVRYPSGNKGALKGPEYRLVTEDYHPPPPPRALPVITRKRPKWYSWLPWLRNH